MKVLTDYDIADELTSLNNTLYRASELLVDIRGETREPGLIHSAHFIINEIGNELTDLINRLIASGNFYKGQAIKREREYRSDEKYFQSLRAQREMGAESAPEATSDDVKKKHNGGRLEHV